MSVAQGVIRPRQPNSGMATLVKPRSPRSGGAAGAGLYERRRPWDHELPLAAPSAVDTASIRSLPSPFGLALPPHAVAGEIDAVGIVDDAIEDGVGVGWVSDQLVPFIHGNLAGDDR